MKRSISVMLVCLVLSCAPLSWARKRHHSSSTGGQFDYYLLALSWAPSYCAEHPSDHSRECAGHATFVLHGLWPQANSGPPPMDCAQGDSVPPETMDHMLQFMPSRGLIQHEWSKHGTCSGLPADDYFRTVERAFTRVQVPEPYRDLTHEAQANVGELEQSFAAANRAPQQAFRVSCHAGELVGMEICLDKNLQYRACSSSARECSSNSLTVRPPQQ